MGVAPKNEHHALNNDRRVQVPINPTALHYRPELTKGMHGLITYNWMVTPQTYCGQSL